MDLRLYFRVLWRFRVLVAFGLLLAIALTFLSLFSVTSKGGLSVRWREQQTYEATETLLLTQHGFPWGRAVPPLTTDRKTGQTTYSPNYADPSRFGSLAVFYAQLANGDAIRSLVNKGGPLHGTYFASTVVDLTSPLRTTLPFVRISGDSSTPGGAIVVAHRASTAFQTYLRTGQNSASIPENQRVVVQVTSTATSAVLRQGRRLTIPIVVFLAVLVATVGLAFILENLRPRGPRAIEATGAVEPDVAVPSAATAAARRLVEELDPAREPRGRSEAPTSVSARSGDLG